jgi:Holliday junction resolvase RusA-like endonuclease
MKPGKPFGKQPKEYQDMIVDSLPIQTEPLVIFIPGRIPSKKNGQQIIPRKKVRGKKQTYFIMAGKDYLKWNAEWIKKLSIVNWGKSTTLEIDILLEFETLGVADLTNKAESIMDTLADAGTIRDDKWTIVPELPLHGRHNKNKPGATITITPQTKENQCSQLDLLNTQ